MKLGLFMMPLHPPEKPRADCYNEDSELVVRAEAMGFSEVWIGQHHSVGWEPIAANDLFIANLIPRTSTIRLGTGVSIVPHHHPVNIASRLAMLDQMSGGRISCGFGQSGVPTDWELFNMPDGKTQGLMTIEGIDMVTKLWQAEPPFDFKGNYWHIRMQSINMEQGIGMMVKPFQQPHPPIAMSIVRNGSMAGRMAGQRGYIPISTSMSRNDVLAEHWQTYCAGAKEAGRPEPDRSIWRVSRSIFIGETTEQAWEFALNSAFGRSWAYLMAVFKSANMLHLVKADPNMSDDELTLEYALRQMCIIGDPDDCHRQMEKLWTDTGGFSTFLMISHDWDDKAKWLRTMDILANKIAPSFPNIEPTYRGK